MLRATFLGWQSWLIQSKRVGILIDPLLKDEIGRGPAGLRANFTFWPPRRFDWTAFPAVDAVFLSHEHEDHVNIPSLARIDRTIPVFLSASSSMATRTIIKEMGFRLTLVRPDDTTRIGDLELLALGPDHASFDPIDEWDTLGYLIRHRAGHGNFFSNVDIEMTPRMLEALAQARAGKMGRRTETLSSVGMSLGLWTAKSARPASAGKMHAPDETAPFATDDSALEIIRRNGRITPVAGQSTVMLNGRVAAIEACMEFLQTPPQSSWPRRPSFWGDPKTDISESLTGSKVFPKKLVPELERGLKQLAEHLYGRELFKILCSLTSTELQGRRSTFLLVLRVSSTDDVLAYEYSPESCSFEAVALPESLRGKYVGWVMCWAADLLGLFRGQFEPRAIVRNYRESWHLPRHGLNGFFQQVLWPFFHPLRRPSDCLKQYRSILASEKRAPLRVFRPSSSSR